MEIAKILEIVKKFEDVGLLNKIIDKLLTPEMARAFAEGLASGAAKAALEKKGEK